ncbi:transmembrane protein, putative [Bodo saltans]|uniref:Transmembrane protein, putative n=1 Tax=Bodo saltans TaxID=75058 RepID=A0A0S4IWH8_BODSA|nr:transmembrane protein, putative [Bodo saltans]|eukprot:CUG06315.1 transmembrane protein, putative [Bodo saltans]
MPRGRYQMYINGVSTGILLTVETDIASLNHVLCSGTETISPEATREESPTNTKTVTFSRYATDSTQPSSSRSAIPTLSVSPVTGMTSSRWSPTTTMTHLTTTLSLSITLSLTVTMSPTITLLPTTTVSPTLSIRPAIGMTSSHLSWPATLTHTRTFSPRTTLSPWITLPPTRTLTAKITLSVTTTLSPSFPVSWPTMTLLPSATTMMPKKTPSPTTTLSSTLLITSAIAWMPLHLASATASFNFTQTTSLEWMKTKPVGRIAKIHSSSRSLSLTNDILPVAQPHSIQSRSEFLTRPQQSTKSRARRFSSTLSHRKTTAVPPSLPSRTSTRGIVATSQSTSWGLQQLSLSLSAFWQDKSVATRTTPSVPSEALDATRTMMSSSKQITAAMTEAGVQIGVDAPQVAPPIVMDDSTAQGTSISCFAIVIVLLVLYAIVILSLVLRRYCWKDHLVPLPLHLNSVRFIAVRHIYVSGLLVTCDDRCGIVHALECATHVSIAACIFTALMKYSATTYSTSEREDFVVGGVDIGWGLMSVVLSFMSVRFLTEVLVRHHHFLQRSSQAPRHPDTMPAPSLKYSPTDPCPSTTSSLMFDATIDVADLTTEAVTLRHADIVNDANEFATLTFMHPAPHAPRQAALLPGQLDIIHEESTMIVAFDDTTCLEGNEGLLGCNDFIFSDSIDVQSLLVEQVACDATHDLHASGSHSSTTKQPVAYDRRAFMMESLHLSEDDIQLDAVVFEDSAAKSSSKKGRLSTDFVNDPPLPHYQMHEVSLMGWITIESQEEARDNDAAVMIGDVALPREASCSLDLTKDQMSMDDTTSLDPPTYLDADSLLIRWVCTLDIILFVAAFAGTVTMSTATTLCTARHAASFLVVIFVIDACVVQPAWIAIVAYWLSSKRQPFTCKACQSDGCPTLGNIVATSRLSAAEAVAKPVV